MSGCSRLEPCVPLRATLDFQAKKRRFIFQTGGGGGGGWQGVSFFGCRWSCAFVLFCFLKTHGRVTSFFGCCFWKAVRDSSCLFDTLPPGSFNHAAHLGVSCYDGSFLLVLFSRKTKGKTCHLGGLPVWDKSTQVPVASGCCKLQVHMFQEA